MRGHLSLAAALLALSNFANAGGPKYVAGASYFDSGTTGTPLTWANGNINYYTDQGNLSSILPGAGADSFVAAAFLEWTSISTAALSATHAGQLAEDVNGTNVTLLNGALSMPADILPSATTIPVGIVYDFDGSVTDALLGSGASASAYCANNSVFGGIDNFGTNAEFLHALIIINGNCAMSSSQLPDLKYHLVRTIGRVLGLDWSQANLNVITRNPIPAANDYIGFPVMHESDPVACVPVANCYSNNGAVDPAQPKMDDEAALSRLYPVNAQNLSSFPGKQIFAQQTARIHGSVYFSDASGMPAQPMQGVNVIARWIDPVTGAPSRAFVASSVSGFLFCGNAGNVITGFTDSTGQNLNRFGSNDSSLEGFFDLAGLEIPNGTTAQYQLTVEAVDPLWSENAGPYGSTSQVSPSGSSQPITVTVTLGGDVQQDVVMSGSATPAQNWYGTTSYSSPVQIPANGNWAGALNMYGAADFFQFPAQANRTLSVIVNALDEFGHASQSKLLPVTGMWSLANPGQSPAPANTNSAFNTSYFGETRLDAQIFQSTTFRLGIADFRGDGRPDYRYNARVLYGDSLVPSRANAAGNTPISIQGLGLQADTVVQSGGLNLPVLAYSATQILVDTPALADGVYDFLLSDANTGGSSSMTRVLTVGAGPTDTLILLSGANPAVPVGGQAPVPFAVRVVANDGVTPVAGASVQFTALPSAGFSVCGGTSNCTILTDQSGTASTYVTVLSTGNTTLTAKLAPASYPSPQQVQAIVFGTSTQLDLSLFTPKVWIAQGATVTTPLNARVLSNGTPVSGATVNYLIAQGTGTLSTTSAQTNATGFATANLQINSASAGVQIAVCVAPNNAPCQTFNALVVPTSSLLVQAVSGVLQIVGSTQGFQPVTVRITDSANPPDSVLGAAVSFQSYIGRVPGDQPIIWSGETGISQPGMPVIVSETKAIMQSDVNGLAAFPLSTTGLSGALAIVGSASSGGGQLQFAAQQLGP